MLGLSKLGIDSVLVWKENKRNYIREYTAVTQPMRRGGTEIKMMNKGVK